LFVRWSSSLLLHHMHTFMVSTATHASSSDV
jgi:hypothetical protein